MLQRYGVRCGGRGSRRRPADVPLIGRFGSALKTWTVFFLELATFVNTDHQMTAPVSLNFYFFTLL